MRNATSTTATDELHGKTLEQVKYLFYIKPHAYVAEFGTELPVWPNARKSERIGGLLGLKGHPTDEQRAAALAQVRSSAAARGVQSSSTGRTQPAKPVYATRKPFHVVPGTPVTEQQKAAALHALRPRTTALADRHRAAIGRPVQQEVPAADQCAHNQYARECLVCLERPADVIVTDEAQPAAEDHGGATDPQWKYMESLLAKLSDWDAEQGGRMRATRARVIAEGRFDKRTASAYIDTLKNLTKRIPAAPRPELPKVPNGRYALDPVREESTNSTVFYHVRTSQTGYVEVLHQYGPSLVPVRWAMVPAVLHRIVEAGVDEAMIRYGRELHVCGACGTELTNDKSRAAGIGPVCATKSR